MDEEQQIIQEPVQEPAPEKQSDKTQAILTAVSPLVAVFFGGSAGGFLMRAFHLPEGFRWACPFHCRRT